MKLHPEQGVEEPPELTPEDNEILDRIWDKIGEEEKAKKIFAAVVKLIKET